MPVAKSLRQQNIEEDENLNQKSESKDPNFKDGWGEFIRIGPAIAIPPITAVPLSAVLIAIWCGARQIPYWDVMSDLGENAISFIAVVIGATLFATLAIQAPSIFRVIDDYEYHQNGKIPRSPETEKNILNRWLDSAILAGLFFAAFILYVSLPVFKELIYGGKSYKENLPNLAWIAGLLSVFSISLLHFVRRRRVFQRFFPWLKNIIPRAALSVFEVINWLWGGIKRFYSGAVKVISSLKLGGGKNIVRGIRSIVAKKYAERTRKWGKTPRNKPANDDNLPHVVNDSIVRPAPKSSFMTFFMMSMCDFQCLMGFYYVAICALQSILNSSEAKSNLYIIYFYLFMMPFIPMVLVLLSSAWALKRSPQSAMIAVFFTAFLLSCVYPGVPTLLDNLALPLGYGGGRPIYLMLRPEAACAHPELADSTLACSSRDLIRTTRVRLAWMGPTKVIVWPELAGALRDPIVFDRKDVPSAMPVRLPEARSSDAS